MKLLEGKVAIVTGAGGGLGRAHALALAAEGAKLVVNDVGVARDGSGGGTSMAEAVVAEIRKAGGTAVANTDSVSDAESAERIVQTALKNFGRLDILVNNAGILRDKTLAKMENDEWRSVIAVHLDGTFYCGRAAARYMKDNNVAGRIVNTTSYAGLVGNFGQSNYGAAKSGIAGLTRVWALELSKYGIAVNAVAPMAKTRMTDDIEAVPAEFKAEHVAPVVVFLAGDLAKDVNGKILGVHGRHLFEYKTVLTPGVKKESDWTAREISEKLGAICGETAAAPAKADTLPEKIKQAFLLMEKAFTSEKAKGWNATLHFVVDGADNYTILVTPEKASVQSGLAGTPTCKVTVQAAALADMIEGKLSGVQAFMSGKIKADNLGDLKRFGDVFDFKKARASAGTAPAPAPSPAIDLAAAFQGLPQVLISERAAGWNGKVVFDVDGTAGWTLTIQDQKASIAAGKAPDAVCTIGGTKEVFADFFSGKIDFVQAQSRLKVTNVVALLKIKQAFEWSKLKTAAPSGGLNESLVGKKYRTPAVFVRPEKIRAFAAVTFDPNERSASTAEKDLVAPPIFPVTLIHDLFSQALSEDHGGDLTRMVHGEQCMRFHAPLRAWDLVTPRAVIAGIDRKESGEILHVDQLFYREGKPVVEMRTSLFFRGASKGAGSPTGVERPTGKKAFSHTVTVREDQPKRYGEVSGDTNPIHMDPAAAKAAGLPGVILQGLCTMALAGAGIEEYLGGDLSRLEEFSVRFSSPVFPGDTLTTEAALVEPGKLALVTTNQNGKPVLTNGFARFH